MNIELIQKIKGQIAQKKQEIKKLNEMLVECVMEEDSEIEVMPAPKDAAFVPVINQDSVAQTNAIKSSGHEIKREFIKNLDGERVEVVEEWIGKKGEESMFIDGKMNKINF